jgi:hypothetical protein
LSQVGFTGSAETGTESAGHDHDRTTGSRTRRAASRNGHACGKWQRELKGAVSRRNAMRWRSWLLLAGSVVMAAAGICLTWEGNPLGGQESGLNVMFGHGASAWTGYLFLGALPVAFAGVGAAMVQHRTVYARAATGGTLTALGSLSWYGIQISGESVRAIGMDSAGNLIEPEAASYVGVGWYLTAAALVVTAVLAVDLTRRLAAQ